MSGDLLWDLDGDFVGYPGGREGFGVGMDERLYLGVELCDFWVGWRMVGFLSLWYERFMLRVGFWPILSRFMFICFWNKLFRSLVFGFSLILA